MEDIKKYASDVVQSTSALNGHSPADWQILTGARDATIAWSRDFGKLYGELLYTHPATSKVMEKHPRADREMGFAAWYERLVSGTPGDAFWAETSLIGCMLASANVDNGQVLALAGKIEEAFLEKCVGAFDAVRAIEVFGAFKRVFDTAVSVMVSSYEEAIISGVTQIGLNHRLLDRMRTVAIKKMIDTRRETLPLMDWTDSLSVNVAEVDNQHKKLVALLNQLHHSSVSGKGNETMKQVLNELTQYTANHFAYEEKILAEHGYPELATHKDLHDKLAAQVVKFNEEFQKGTSSISADLFLFLRSWLNGHIRGSDRHYGKFLNSKGVF